ncbi:50S ribosomal protein L3 [Candidatus Microgenomates bacterium]|nr:50S ribosomal protein L3 [Candidatus Microgenomates bacterium]
MLNAILGEKIKQTQKFTENGQRIPVTFIKAGPCPVVQIKTKDNDGYWAVQLGFGSKQTKRTTKPILEHFKKAGLKKTPRFLREIRINENQELKVGEEIKVNDVFKTGDKLIITGISKGKGFAGVMKRWGFSGGPRTHGQSDRQRAPGSIGQGTTPGRVHKGKKMPGRMGGDKVSIKGLKVIEIDEEKNLLIVKGLVPGVKSGLLLIKKENYHGGQG